MNRLDPIQESENNRRASALLAHAIALNNYYFDRAGGVAALRKSYGSFEWATKSVVAAITADDLAIALAPLTTGFLASVDVKSILGKISGAIPIRLGEMTRFQLGVVEAREVGEGEAKPIAHIEFDVTSDRPTKLTAEIVVTRDALRGLNPDTLSGITAGLVSATAKATDIFAITTLVAGAGSPTSEATPGALLSAISEGRPELPVLIGDYVGLLSLDPGTLRELRELGVQILTSPAASGKLVALDAAGLLISDLGAEVTTTRDASVYMDDGDSPMTATLTSLWQNNLGGIRAERWLRLVARADAVAYASLES